MRRLLRLAAYGTVLYAVYRAYRDGTDEYLSTLDDTFVMGSRAGYRDGLARNVKLRMNVEYGKAVQDAADPDARAR
jgi:hypothetical protein